eukprot:scaffold51278_cov58-Phaeocystis_antarctica.AAC.3
MYRQPPAAAAAISSACAVSGSGGSGSCNSPQLSCTDGWAYSGSSWVQVGDPIRGQRCPRSCWTSSAASAASARVAKRRSNRHSDHGQPAPRRRRQHHRSRRRRHRPAARRRDAPSCYPPYRRTGTRVPWRRECGAGCGSLWAGTNGYRASQRSGGRAPCKCGVSSLTAVAVPSTHRARVRPGWTRDAPATRGPESTPWREWRRSVWIAPSRSCLPPPGHRTARC